MRQSIQQLREERGESRGDLARVIGVSANEVTTWEMGQAEPGVFHLRALAEHFDVGEEHIDLQPGRPPSIGERVIDALTE